MSKTFYISFFLFIFFISYLAVRQSFTLALSGDDWLIHYTIWSIFEVRKEGNLLNPLVYFCTYCPHYLFLSIIKYFFRFEPFYYYFFSYLIRTGVSLILFFVLKKLTKRILPAVLASTFFTVSYIGIETTDWVFNLNHYLGVGVVSIFLFKYFRAKETQKLKDIFQAGLLLATALTISPPRMHGLFPLILIAEIGWLFIERRRFNFKKATERLAVCLGFYFLIIKGIGEVVSILRDHSINLGADWVIGGYGTELYSQQINQGLKLIKSNLLQGHTDFLIDPIASLGNYIVPGIFLSKIPFSFTASIFPLFLIFALLTYSILHLLGLSKKNGVFYVINLLSWTIFIYFLKLTNPNTFTFPRTTFALVGGITVIFTLWLFFLLKRSKPELAHLILVSCGWMFTFILFPWLLSPASEIMLAWGRYSVQQSAGFAFWVAILFTLIIDYSKTKRKFFSLGISYLMIMLLALLQLVFTNIYFSHVNSYRNIELDKKYWNIITTSVPNIDKNAQNIFLLLTDRESSEIAEAIRFGFFGRSIMHYNITNQNFNPIMVVNEYAGVLSSVYDGKYLIKHGRINSKPIEMDHVYAFYLQNKHMYEITKDIREKLKSDLLALQTGNLQLPPITP